ncbi:MAG TPA: 1-deoxy-D-xylulose-5-phosphate reductoisomerase [Sphingobacteriaceae bacterium]|nr:1-deoxy-D-xylulose-5-phosphate reductoisomerase [Sphingobacteriaceae bacterium]
MKLKNIAILGSTGSIGTQALDVIRANPAKFRVSVLTARNQAELLIEQAREFKPGKVVITDEAKYNEVKSALSGLGIEVLTGNDALSEAARESETDMVLIALVGFSGLKPTISAIKAGKDIALANKETLVVAGELVIALAEQHGVKILPVDSEHSAIFQCLAGEENNPVEKIYLTASGGPFRGKDNKFLSSVSSKDALKHPSWVMGNKITIDSASLMNKGLEVIEAKWLFNLDASQIDIIVHPQSVIHSIVQFEDGSMKAQMGVPDMKMPIQYALSYPNRIKNDLPRFDFLNYPELTFEKADTSTFRNLAIAFEALRAGGNMPCIVNAANEVVVAEFLNNRIGFLQMSDIIETCVNKMSFINKPSLDDYIETDKEARLFTSDLVTNY